MSKTNESSGSRVMSVSSKIIVYGAIFLFLVCTGLIVPIVQFAWILTTGWFFFLKRTSGEINVSIGSLAWFTASLFVLAFFVHRTAVWLVSRIATAALPDAAAPPIQAWPVRRSCVLLLAALSSFIAGVCLVGITHEVVWITTSKEPLMTMDSGRGPARRTQSRNNLKQLGLAFHNHHDRYQGFPESMTFDEQGQIRHGWSTSLLPFFDAMPLYDKVRFDLVWSATENRPSFEQQVWAFLNPAVVPHHDENGYALIHYAGNSLVLQPGRKRRMSEITDGTSNTIFAGEVNANFPPWGKPGNCRDPRLGINKSPQGFGSPFKGGAQLLLGDGSVRFVSDNIDPQVLKALATPDGGETVGEY